MEKRKLSGFAGTDLAADAFGSPDDPTVLLIPGIFQTREVWHGCADALARAGRYAVTVDLRGHGDSDHAADGRYDLDAYASDLKAILDAMRTRACIVASGLGSLAAIAAVGESEPDLVSGLVLVDSTIWFSPEMIEGAQKSAARREVAFDHPDAIIDAIAGLYPSEPRPEVTSRLLAAYERGEDGRYHWRGDLRARGQWDPLSEQERLQASAGRISAPVALIRGELNEVISGEAIRQLADLIKGAETAEIQGAGHYSPFEHEDEFNGVLLDFLERRVPREPITYVGGSEPRMLRDALGCFATGVTVVTTATGDGQPVGLTANSFTSVSLDPPLILFSLANQSGSLETFRSSRKFAINVLHIGQQPISNRFAQRGPSRFEGIDWEYRVEGGSPILSGALASFDCQTYAVHDGGDHTIFIGKVHHAWFESHRDPLLYFRGKYRRLHFS
tara:strand:+ start:20668 stop:22005 length:1338 start_codon:yes stop_codon:yes gene_type:complete